MNSNKKMSKNSQSFRVVMTMAAVLFGAVASPLFAQSSGKAEIDRMFLELEKFKEKGDYNGAVPLAIRIVKTSEEIFGANHRNTGTMINNLAWLYQAQGKFQEAETHFSRALKISKLHHGMDHPVSAMRLNNLAYVCQAQGKYDEAEPLYVSGLKIAERSFGKTHPNTAICLGNLANSYRSQGKLGDAEPLYIRALKIRETHSGANHLDTAIDLLNLGELYREQTKYTEAEHLCNRGLKIRLAHLGDNHPDTGSALHKLGWVYLDQGKYGEAEPLFIRAIKIRELCGQMDHPDTGASLHNLAFIYSARGQHKDAKPLYEQALKIAERQLGPEHPDTAIGMKNLARLYGYLGEYDQAENLFLKALDVTHRHYTRMLRYFPDEDCLTMRTNLRMTDVAGNLLSGPLAAKEQILFKGAVVEAMSRRRAAEKKLSESAGGRDLLARRSTISEAYRKSILVGGLYHKSSRDLEQQLGAVEKQIATLLSDDKTLTIGDVDLAAVQGSLKRSDVLVEVFRYLQYVLNEESEPRYSSVLIRREAPPVYLPHGSAGEIESAIDSYRTVLLDQNGELAGVEANAVLKSAESQLYELMLAPIEKLIKPGDKIFFSLDSQLHFLPLGMLRDAEGIPFGRKYEVRYVASGRDLVRKPLKKAGRHALILGNPTFRNNGPLLAFSETKEANAKTRDLRQVLRNGMSSEAGSVYFSPLPGTAREIALLENKLTSKGYDVEKLTGKSATETALKDSIEGHDIVHLATHGFFLNEVEFHPEKGAGLNMDIAPKNNPNTIQNPMLRSGLALCGAQSTFNLWKGGEVPPPSQDGILMAAEANLLNLQGTDLVVLSACETAKGKALDGEGVIGLRRAFSAAGANNTIMTLWPVNDEATVEVIDAFYDKYLSGVSAPTALAEVQHELYDPFVKKYGEVEAIARLAPFICMSVGKNGSPPSLSGGSPTLPLSTINNDNWAAEAKKKFQIGKDNQNGTETR